MGCGVEAHPHYSPPSGQVLPGQRRLLALASFSETRPEPPSGLETLGPNGFGRALPFPSRSCLPEGTRLAQICQFFHFQSWGSTPLSILDKVVFCNCQPRRVPFYVHVVSRRPRRPIPGLLSAAVSVAQDALLLHDLMGWGELLSLHLRWLPPTSLLATEPCAVKATTFLYVTTRLKPIGPTGHVRFGKSEVDRARISHPPQPH